MNKTDFIIYKDYYGSVHFNAEEELFFGKIEFIRDLINYEAFDAKSLVRAFKEAVEDYLDYCKIQKKIPDKPFKGSFNVRISPNLHKEASLYALQHGNSLNSIVSNALEVFIKEHTDQY